MRKRKESLSVLANNQSFGAKPNFNFNLKGKRMVQDYNEFEEEELNEKIDFKAFSVGLDFIATGRATTRDNRGVEGGQSQNGGSASSIRCFICKKEGHTERFSPSRKK